MGSFSLNTGYSPNFKGVNLVQVSKKAFLNPKDTQGCFDTFAKTIEGAMGIKKASSISNKAVKTVMYPENPSYSFVKGVLQKFNLDNYSVDWFAKNTGTNIKGEIKPDFNSYFVLTGKEKDAVNEIFSPQNSTKAYIQASADFSHEGGLNEVQTKALQRFAQDGDSKGLKNKTIMILYAKMAEIIDAQTQAAIKGAPSKNFQVHTLDEIQKITDDFV